MKAARGLALTMAGLGMAILAGCVGNFGSGSYSQTADGAASSGDYTVMAGDTFWGISSAHGVPLQALIDANSVPAPYVLQVGQQIRIPGLQPSEAALAANAATPIEGSDYSVQPGDTLYAISRRSAIPVSSLAAANGLTAPYDLQVGQSLSLPADLRDPTLLAAAPTPAPAPLVPAGVGTVSDTGTQAAVPDAGQPADLLGSLQGSPPAVAADVTAVEQTTVVETLGQGEGTTVVQEVSADGSATEAAAVQTAVLQVPNSKPARDVALPSVAKTPPPPPTNAALPAPPKRQGRLFDWPVTGKVISSHGPKKGGLHNDGINIAAPAGTPVRAAESGVVAYTGGDLKGFGKLVLIKHRDGYVTAYAHNSQILVQRGETVRRGDVIARVGETGSVDKPQLHFEIRKDAKPVNPSGLMVGIAG